MKITDIAMCLLAFVSSIYWFVLIINSNKKIKNMNNKIKGMDQELRNKNYLK